VPKRWNRDPIRAAYDAWVGKGWEATADGMTAVTSVLRVHQLLLQRADEILAPEELTFARYEVLLVLHLNDDAVSLSFLAQALKVQQASITNLVDKLEKQGYLARRPHPSDRRVTLAQITPTGQARTRTAIERLNAELYSQLGLTADEARALIALFVQMRRALGGPDELGENGGADAAGALPQVAEPAT
jgi:DNA-binding MarR family transcriptional regulator